MKAPGIIRRLWAIERDKIRDHLLRLDPEDHLLRFGAHMSDAHVKAYCDGLDWSRTVVIGCLLDGEVRGIGELKLMGEGWPRAAEAAISVEKPYQNRGVGTELMRRLIVSARNRSIRTLHMLCLLENSQVVRMTRKVGAALRFDGGEVEGRLALASPNHLTLLVELLDDAGLVLALRPSAWATTRDSPAPPDPGALHREPDLGMRSGGA